MSHGMLVPIFGGPVSFRSEAFYKAYEANDASDWPNLQLTGRAGLEVTIFDCRCPTSVLQFLNLVLTCARGRDDSDGMYDRVDHITAHQGPSPDAKGGKN